jgi:calcineurin-like phosphoesterase family protein
MKDNVDFKFEDGSKVFFTSDTHWGHTNILEFCNRPYKNVEEMNHCLIDNWNKKVPADGLVFHLGDFAWGGYPFWKNIRDQLNGKIILIKGNHDEKNLTTTGAQELFEHVAYQMKIRIEGRAIYLNHNPFLCYGGTYRDPKGLVYQCHGHVHLSKTNPNGLDVERVLKYEFPTQYDVGVDFNDYTPISWLELNFKIQSQIRENENMRMWMEKPKK